MKHVRVPPPADLMANNSTWSIPVTRRRTDDLKGYTRYNHRITSTNHGFARRRYHTPRADDYMSTKKSCLLVSGYIRKNFQSYAYCDEIIQLCFMWFSPERDHWDLKRVSEDILIHNDIVRRLSSEYRRDGIACGEVTVSIVTDMKEWKLQCISTGNESESSGLVVGISNCGHSVMYGVNLKRRWGYGNIIDGYEDHDDEDSWFLGHKKVDIWGKIGKGDVITILYIRVKDREHGQLYFGVNDAELELIIDSISFAQGQAYNLALTISFEGESWELLQ